MLKLGELHHALAVTSESSKWSKCNQMYPQQILCVCTISVQCSHLVQFAPHLTTLHLILRPVTWAEAECRKTEARFLGKNNSCPVDSWLLTCMGETSFIWLGLIDVNNFCHVQNTLNKNETLHLYILIKIQMLQTYPPLKFKNKNSCRLLYFLFAH